MEKLLESLTRAANAVAAYYEDQVRPRPPMTPAEIAAAKVAMQAHVAEHAAMAGKPRTGPTHEEHVAAHIAAAKEPPQEVPVEPVVKRKAGRPKKNPTAAAPAPAEPAMLPIDPEYASLTDAESAKKIFEVGEALIEAYPALGANGPDGEPAPAPEKHKAGRPKKNPTPGAAPDAPKTDAPAGLPVDPEFASLNEEESTKRVYEIGEAMMDAYPKEEAGKNAPDGSPAPEGFFIAAAILKERFGVEKLSKLNHAQRLQFMTILKGYLAKAGGVASAPVEGASVNENDPNLGV